MLLNGGGRTGLTEATLEQRLGGGEGASHIEFLVEELNSYHSVFSRWLLGMCLACHTCSFSFPCVWS